jgi:hypothetical protein
MFRFEDHGVLEEEVEEDFDDLNLTAHLSQSKRNHLIYYRHYLHIGLLVYKTFLVFSADQNVCS